MSSKWSVLQNLRSGSLSATKIEPPYDTKHDIAVDVHTNKAGES